MRYFGTDGIRDKVNQGLMTAEMALKFGQAWGLWLKQSHPEATSLNVILGQDSRVSGDMLANAAAAGMAATGVNVHLAQILPTPGIAYITRALKFDGGVVITASHNPYYDNGLKFFKASGYKLDNTDEAEIENIVDALDGSAAIIAASEPGRINLLPEPAKIYSDFILRQFEDVSLAGLRVVLDCANGAASFIAKNIFASLGVKVDILHAQPNGLNINAECGSEYPAALAQMVKKLRADAGFAFDGDADRVIAVNAGGEKLSGDCLIAILAKLMQAKGHLKNDAVVTTIMSNLGLKQALDGMGIKHFTTQVGDRHVIHEMLTRDAVLGGEDSGHIVFRNAQTAGDGILTALRLLEAMRYFEQPLAQLAELMRVFPQKLINVDIKRKPDLKTVPEIAAAVAEAENRMGERGRILVRYSGTQPMCRIMVEGADAEAVTALCEELAQIVRTALN